MGVLSVCVVFKLYSVSRSCSSCVCNMREKNGSPVNKKNQSRMFQRSIPNLGSTDMTGSFVLLKDCDLLIAKHLRQKAGKCDC